MATEGESLSPLHQTQTMHSYEEQLTKPSWVQPMLTNPEAAYAPAELEKSKEEPWPLPELNPYQMKNQSRKYSSGKGKMGMIHT